MAGTRDADIEKASFFLDRPFCLGTFMGEYAVLRTNQPDIGKLKPLGGMKGDESDPFAFFGFLFFALLFQRQSVEKSTSSFARMPLAVSGQGVEQFVDILLSSVRLSFCFTALLNNRTLRAVRVIVPRYRCLVSEVESCRYPSPR